MRSINPQLKAKLESGATTLCRCWLLTRSDGQSLGFTDHDSELVVDGTIYAADSALGASVLESSNGLSIDNAQAIGALQASGLTEADIHAGRYDNARVEQWLVDWTQTDLRVLLFSGTIGDIKRGDVAFEAELRGLTEALNQPVGRTFSSRCDRVLGDAKCGFDLNQPGYSFETSVGAILDPQRFSVGGLVGVADDWLTHGQVHWLTGANAGLQSEIKFDRTRGSERIIELWREPPLPLSVGDGCNLLAGCDKSVDMCKGKFLNFINYRGFPHIPGEDWAQAYPTSGARHDGTSQRS